MRYILVICAALILCASTCNKTNENAPAAVVTPPAAGAPNQPAPGQELKIPQAVEPDLKASAEELSAAWPADMPKVDESAKWQFVEGAKTADGKHLRKVYLTGISTHEGLRVFELTLAAKGYTDRQVDDPSVFAREEFAKEGVYAIVTVAHDNDSHKNRVVVTVHLS